GLQLRRLVVVQFRRDAGPRSRSVNESPRALQVVASLRALAAGPRSPAAAASLRRQRVVYEFVPDEVFLLRCARECIRPRVAAPVSGLRAGQLRLAKYAGVVRFLTCATFQSRAAACARFHSER